MVPAGGWVSKVNRLSGVESAWQAVAVSGTGWGPSGVGAFSPWSPRAGHAVL